MGHRLEMLAVLMVAGCGPKLPAVAVSDCNGDGHCLWKDHDQGLCRDARCVYPDETCASGYRFGPQAGDLSDECEPTEGTTLVDGTRFPSDVAVDATHVYWTSSGDFSVMKIPKDGGQSVTLAQDQDSPMGITLDSTHVYWVTWKGGQLARVAKGGGQTEVIHSGFDAPQWVEVNETHAFVVAEGGIYRVPKQGGEVMSMGSGAPSDLALDEKNVYFVHRDVSFIAKPDGGGLGQIVQMDLDGENSIVLADKLYQPQHVAVFDGWVYFTSVSSKVERVPVGGGEVQMLSQGQAGPGDVVVDESGVYWVQFDSNGRVQTVPHEGGKTTFLSFGCKSPLGLATDDTHVYFTSSDWRILKAPKPGN